jgi:hypothetical protein
MTQPSPEIIDADFEIVRGFPPRRPSTLARLGRWCLRAAILTAVVTAVGVCVFLLGLQLHIHNRYLIGIATALALAAGVGFMQGLLSPSRRE